MGEIMTKTSHVYDGLWVVKKGKHSIPVRTDESGMFYWMDRYAKMHYHATFDEARLSIISYLEDIR